MSKPRSFFLYISDTSMLVGICMVSDVDRWITYVCQRVSWLQIVVGSFLCSFSSFLLLLFSIFGLSFGFSTRRFKVRTEIEGWKSSFAQAIKHTSYKNNSLTTALTRSWKLLQWPGKKKLEKYSNYRVGKHDLTCATPLTSFPTMRRHNLQERKLGKLRRHSF